LIAEYPALDATSLAALIARREVSAAEVLRTAISRIEAMNPELNAVAQTFFDRASSRPAAPGPFTGVPFLVKDNVLELEGTEISAVHGWFGGAKSTGSATLAQRHEAAGLVTLG
jgi:amidase